MGLKLFDNMANIFCEPGNRILVISQAPCQPTVIPVFCRLNAGVAHLNTWRPQGALKNEKASRAVYVGDPSQQSDKVSPRLPMHHIFKGASNRSHLIQTNELTEQMLCHVRYTGFDWLDRNLFQDITQCYRLSEILGAHFVVRERSTCGDSGDCRRNGRWSTPNHSRRWPRVQCERQRPQRALKKRLDENLVSRVKQMLVSRR
jgi:hypothetical protein